MSTRSFIAVAGGMDYKMIYCHFDGYLEGIGQCLKDNYNDLEKINKMIELGYRVKINQGEEGVKPNKRNK